MQTVYRLEYLNNGMGVYSRGWYTEFSSAVSRILGEAPEMNAYAKYEQVSPIGDIKWFGWSSIKQAEMYCSAGDLATLLHGLKGTGLCFAKLLVPANDVINASAQVIFSRRKARPIAYMNMEEALQYIRSAA